MKMPKSGSHARLSKALEEKSIYCQPDRLLTVTFSWDVALGDALLVSRRDTKQTRMLLCRFPEVHRCVGFWPLCVLL